MNNLIKIFKDARLPARDQRLYDSEWSQYGDEKSLRALLTNKGNEISARFANRIIKVYEIFKDKLDKDIAITQLASWAAAGIHCTTRAEAETNKFYLGCISEGNTFEGEEGTLELAVAKSLATLRRSLLETLIPENENERLHQLANLEKKVFKSLSLIGDSDQFEDRYAQIVKSCYKEMTEPDILKRVLNLYTPHAMIEWILKETNKRNSTIPCSKILERFEWQASHQKNSTVSMGDFYDEDGIFLTKEGAQALLYSLGYLEKDLSVK